MRKGTCKHYDGIVSGTCRAGVNLRDLAGGAGPGWASRIPCLLNKQSSVPCSLREEPTDEELAASAAEWDKVIQKITKVQPLVNQLKAAHKGQDYSGTHECPACGGVLHISIAGCNGHARGKCDTPDCLRWME